MAGDCGSALRSFRDRPSRRRRLAAAITRCALPRRHPTPAFQLRRQRLFQRVEAAVPALLVAVADFGCGEILVREDHFRRVAAGDQLDRYQRFGILHVFGLLFRWRNLLPCPGKYKLFRWLHLAKRSVSAIGETFFWDGNFDYIAAAGTHIEFGIFRIVLWNVLAHPLL